MRADWLRGYSVEVLAGREKCNELDEAFHAVRGATVYLKHSILELHARFDTSMPHVAAREAWRGRDGVIQETIVRLVTVR